MERSQESNCAANLHSETLIRNETPAQMFSCGFYKNSKNTFFLLKKKIRLTTSVI